MGRQHVCVRAMTFVLRPTSAIAGAGLRPSLAQTTSAASEARSLLRRRSAAASHS